jgi:hypothetical protein
VTSNCHDLARRRRKALAGRRGSVDAFYLLALSERSPGRAFAEHILPAFLGDTIGGVGFVAALNHAQWRRNSQRRHHGPRSHSCT